MKPPVENPIIKRKDQQWILSAVPLNPSGLCMCGCREFAPVAKSNRREVGYIKGQTIRYISGHENRKNGPIMYIKEDRGYKTKCWIWQWCLSYKGYGVVSKVRDPSGLAHVWMYKKYGGIIPEGLQLDHLCKVKCCVNPEHLEPTTNAENCRRSKKTRLTHEIVYDLRKMREETGLSYEKLGVVFGINRTTAWQICSGLRWIAV